jgi:hypothetical protein
VAEISATRAAICRPLIACIIRVSTAAIAVVPTAQGPAESFLLRVRRDRGCDYA